MPTDTPTNPPIPWFRCPWRFVRRLAEIVRREGPASLWFRVWAQLGYRRTGYLVCALPEAPAPGDPAAPIAMTMLGDDDAPEYVAFRRGATADDFHDRLARGFRCHAARCDGLLASVTWTATGRAILWMLDAEFDVPAGCVYLFDSFTHPDFRGRRVQGAVFAQVRDAALRDGLERAVTFVVPENRPNLRSRGRLGFKRLGTVGRIGAGRCAWYFSRGEAPVMWRRPR